MPYRVSIATVLDRISAMTKPRGQLVDLMCGPGSLLSHTASRRPDLSLTGVDTEESYVDFARSRGANINLVVGDILAWKPQQRFDAVVCTGALHHIPYEEQRTAIARMASWTRPGGFALISDCYIDGFANERERKIAAAKLGYEYLRASIENGAPKDVVEELLNILRNDIMGIEFKTSLKKRVLLFHEFFGAVETVKTWPANETEYGDYITICRP